MSAVIALAFGLGAALPPNLTTAWGARLIFPADLLYDRQSFAGRDTPAGNKLHAWLNSGGGLKKALAASRRMSSHYQLEPSQHQQVTLFEDDTAIVVANAQASYGYLYVAAWLKEEVPPLPADHISLSNGRSVWKDRGKS